MAHLTETEFIDLVDGALEQLRADHVRGCPECSAQLEALRGTLASLAVDPGDQPSAFVWNTLPARVAAAIAEEPRASWSLRRPALAALTCAVALLVVLGAALWRSSQPAQGPAPGSVSGSLTPGTVPEATAGLPAEDDVELDAAWAVVRTAADDLDYDAALEAGISARPGTAENAAMELSPRERAELARLIEREIRRTGA